MQTPHLTTQAPLWSDTWKELSKDWGIIPVLLGGAVKGVRAPFLRIWSLLLDLAPWGQFPLWPCPHLVTLGSCHYLPAFLGPLHSGQKALGAGHTSGSIISAGESRWAIWFLRVFGARNHRAWDKNDDSVPNYSMVSDNQSASSYLCAKTLPFVHLGFPPSAGQRATRPLPWALPDAHCSVLAAASLFS